MTNYNEKLKYNIYLELETMESQSEDQGNPQQKYLQLEQTDLDQ